MSQVGVGEELSTDVDELQGTVLELDQRLRATTDELELARYRARLERWKEQARGTRRYRRAMGVLEGASTIVDYLLAPFRMIAELLRDVPAPPRPAPPQTGRGSGLSARMADAFERFDEGFDEPAVSLANELLEHVTRDDAIWEFVRRVLIRHGAVTTYLEALRRRRSVDGNEALLHAERKEHGRLRELDPRWWPAMPPGTPYEPVEGRVLHIIKESAPYLTNGYTMRSGYTVASQQDAGLDPVVVTSLGFPRTALGDDVEPTVEDLATAEVFGVRHHRLDLGPDYPYATMPWDQLLEDACLAIQPIVEAERPQLVQAGSGFRGIETALLGLAVARAYGIPFVYEVRSFLEHTWTWELDRAERGEHFDMRSRREVQLMLEADHVITIAESMRDDLVERGVPADHITIVPNGVDTTAFQPRDRDPRLAAELGLPADTPVVGYVSNLGQREGLEVLVRAVLDLRRSGRDVVGLLIGEGPMREDLEELLRESGDPEAVVMPGRIPHDQIQEHYALFDVFVIPRLDDRAARLVTPLKPFEAMALERAMVVSDLPALREITAPPDRGRTFAVGDHEDLARVVGELLDDDAERERSGRASRAWVEQERDWSMNGARYRGVYDRILREDG